MKIILADDERLTRLGLKNMIEELYPDAHQFLEASDGEKLLEMLEQETPDLIFLDIHMPRLTGLQAFSKFSAKRIPVVMLTGYAEFAYAKEALKLGALDYLLKPASLDEVQATMEKALAICREREALLKKDYELEFEKILDLYTTIGFLQAPRFVLPPYTVLLFYFDHYEQETFRRDLDALSTVLSRICKRRRALSTISFLSTGELCFLASASITADEFIPDLKYFNETCGCIATGFYASADGLSSLFGQIESIQKEESLRYCVCLGSLISDRERAAHKELLPFSGLLEKLLLAHRAGDSMEFQKLIPQLDQFSHQDRILSLCDPSLNRILSLESGEDVHIRSYSQLTEFLKQMISGRQTVDLVDRINAYVDEHYMDQIGINTIADMIDISPNYLSRIYKLKTGENFSDHLTGVRMKKARELMSGGQTSSVRETAERVGYFSTRYFTKVFLKNTGMLPSEYMKRFVLSLEN